MPEATIASFILRFTKEHGAEDERVTPPWRGVIRHVQTNEEARFTQIEDALDFLARFVDIAPNEEDVGSVLLVEKGEL